MSVAALLELDPPGRGSDHASWLRVAARSWPEWVSLQPALQRIPGGLAELRPWLRQADPAAADEVLQALARLASVNGANDETAAMTLAWALLPGASHLARRLTRYSSRADEEVAVQLWLTIRHISPRATRIALTVIREVRKRALAELGVIPPLTSSERWWLDNVALAGPETMSTWETQHSFHDHERTPADQLTDLLTNAISDGVISPAQAALLRDIARVNAAIHGTRCRKGFAGLLSHRASTAVGERLGISPRSVRRHTSHAVDALTTWLHQPAATAPPTPRTSDGLPQQHGTLGIPA